MIQHVYRDDFVAAFKAIRPDQFTVPGLDALFEYFTEFEASTGEDITLDVIAICCEYEQYDSIHQLNDDYGENYADWDELEDSGEFAAVIRWNHPSGATWKGEAIVHHR